METTPRKAKPQPQDSSPKGICKTLYIDEEKVSAVTAAMPPEGTIERIAEAFSILSDPTRVRLLYALSLKELCVCDLAKILGRSMGATSHQLQLLRRSQLVKYRMEGKLAYYSLHNEWVRQLISDAIRRTGEGGAL